MGQGHRSPGQGQQPAQLAPIEAQQPAQLAPIEAPGRSKHLGDRSRSSAADRAPGARSGDRAAWGSKPIEADRKPGECPGGFYPGQSPWSFGNNLGPGASIEPGLGSGFLNWFGYAVCELLGDRSPVCSDWGKVTLTHGRRRRDRSTRNEHQVSTRNEHQVIELRDLFRADPTVDRERPPQLGGHGGVILSFFQNEC